MHEEILQDGILIKNALISDNLARSQHLRQIYGHLSQQERFLLAEQNHLRRLTENINRQE